MINCVGFNFQLVMYLRSRKVSLGQLGPRIESFKLSRDDKCLIYQVLWNINIIIIIIIISISIISSIIRMCGFVPKKRASKMAEVK